MKRFVLKKIVFLFIVLVFVFHLVFNYFEILDNEKTINISVNYLDEYSNTFYYPLGTTVEDIIDDLELNDNETIRDYTSEYVLENNQIINIVVNNDLISINNATIEELIKLPGVGKVTANNIINYRNTYGSFECLDELLNVKGIGEKKYENIKEYISL